jgi:hypothetical protein
LHGLLTRKAAGRISSAAFRTQTAEVYSSDELSEFVVLVSELESEFSDEFEELDIVLELGEIRIDWLESDSCALLDDSIFCDIGADELDIEPLLSAGAGAVVPEALDDGLCGSCAKVGTVNAIAAANAEALRTKPNRGFPVAFSTFGNRI